VLQDLSQSSAYLSMGALSLGGNSFEILKQVAHLLQKAFEAMKEATASSKALVVDHSVPGSKGVESLEMIQNMSKPTHVESVETSQQATHQTLCKENNGKVPYCFHCKTKGHA
jgi:polynucleotide 5'-kinase involved in rRNA processing